MPMKCPVPAQKWGSGEAPAAILAGFPLDIAPDFRYFAPGGTRCQSSGGVLQLPEPVNGKAWKKYMPYLMGCLLLVLPPVALGSLFVFTDLWTRIYIRNWGDLPFDEHRWQTADTNDPNCIRGQMVKSLLHTHHLRGMPREQVLQLLGPPDNTRDLPARGRSPVRVKGAIAYYLGMRGGFGIDPDLLWLDFDDSEKVKGWFIDTS